MPQGTEMRPWTTTHGSASDQAVTWTAIAMAESSGRQTDSGYGNPSSFQITSQGGAEGSSRLFVGNLTFDSHDSMAGFDCSELTQWASNTPTAPQPDSSAVATLINVEFDSALHSSDGFFLM